MRRRSAAFTMIEMLAVMLLMGILVSGVVSFYLQLSGESNAAAEATRELRRTTAVVDRIARELEGSLLVVKPSAVDPLDHPWLFFAENDGGGEGSDRMRFTTRSHRPRASASYESDLAVVAYSLRENDAGVIELRRWSSPRLPEGLDRKIPDDEEDGAQVLVEGVADFGVRFLTEGGEWKDAWDSSSIADSSQLPLAAEIRLALLRDPPPEDGAETEPVSLRRHVVLPLRPLDLETLLQPAAAGGGREDDEEDEEGDGDEDDDETRQETACTTVSQCLTSHPDLDLAPALAAAGLDPNVLVTVSDQCASDFSSFVALPEDCQ